MGRVIILNGVSVMHLSLGKWLHDSISGNSHIIRSGTYKGLIAFPPKPSWYRVSQYVFLVGCLYEQGKFIS